MPYRDWNALAWAVPGSRLSMPTKWAVEPSSFAAATTYGDSRWQSAHHEPQTVTTVGLPRMDSRDSGRPSRSWPESATASPRSATWICRIAPSPLT